MKKIGEILNTRRDKLNVSLFCKTSQRSFTLSVEIAKRRAQPTKRSRDNKTDVDDETDGKRLKNDEEEDDNVKQAVS